jgi:hypothetical protein
MAKWVPVVVQFEIHKEDGNGMSGVDSLHANGQISEVRAAPASCFKGSSEALFRMRRGILRGLKAFHE